MANIAIPYAAGPSPAGPGRTRQAAMAIATALGQDGCNARLIDVEVMFRMDWDALAAADAILFGAPAAQGSANAAFTAFLEDTADLASRRGWADKIAAGFTVGAAASATTACLQHLMLAALHHGMIWVGHAPQGHDDAMAQPGLALIRPGAAGHLDAADLDAADLAQAQHFALRVARVARRWSA